MKECVNCKHNNVCKYKEKVESKENQEEPFEIKCKYKETKNYQYVTTIYPAYPYPAHPHNWWYEPTCTVGTDTGISTTIYASTNNE